MLIQIHTFINCIITSCIQNCVVAKLMLSHLSYIAAQATQSLNDNDRTY